ncbi:hypothetical protein SISNIDRAFT_470489 [Sistotremastrum niveocremeum HHB9708]|uniref:Uncharacterized protein n=1 Tax=Sistotremastrum niveocremeum HHB9708 TaxID=1314777 RepID=A0A164NTB8_9AGAM|nr:hypothetical protein SISNIDRAFT_470489 [Sistotremastrum niveocremeum HHB9708]
MEERTVTLDSTQLELLDSALTAHPIIYTLFVHQGEIQEIDSFLEKIRALRKVDGLTSTWTTVEQSVICAAEDILFGDSPVSEKVEIAATYLDHQLTTLETEDHENLLIDLTIQNLVNCLRVLPSDKAVDALSTSIMPRILSLPLADQYCALPAMSHQLLTLVLDASRTDSSQEAFAVREAVVQVIQIAADIPDMDLVSRIVVDAVSACLRGYELEVPVQSAEVVRGILICEGVLGEVLRLMRRNKTYETQAAFLYQVLQPLVAVVDQAAWTIKLLSSFLQDVLSFHSFLVDPIPDALVSRMSMKGLDSAYLGDACPACDDVMMRIAFGPEGKRPESVKKISAWFEDRASWLSFFDLLSVDEQDRFLREEFAITPSLRRTLPSNVQQHYHDWTEERIREALDYQPAPVHSSPIPPPTVANTNSDPEPNNSAHTPPPFVVTNVDDPQHSPSSPINSPSPMSPSARRALFKQKPRLDSALMRNLTSELGKRQRDETTEEEKEGSEQEVVGPSPKRPKASAARQPIDSEEWEELRGRSADVSVVDLYEIPSAAGSQTIPVIAAPRASNAGVQQEGNSGASKGMNLTEPERHFGFRSPFPKAQAKVVSDATAKPSKQAVVKKEEQSKKQDAEELATTNVVLGRPSTSKVARRLPSSGAYQTRRVTRALNAPPPPPPPPPSSTAPASAMPPVADPSTALPSNNDNDAEATDRAVKPAEVEGGQAKGGQAHQDAPAPPQNEQDTEEGDEREQQAEEQGHQADGEEERSLEVQVREGELHKPPLPQIRMTSHQWEGVMARKGGSEVGGGGSVITRKLSDARDPENVSDWGKNSVDLAREIHGHDQLKDGVKNWLALHSRIPLIAISDNFNGCSPPLERKEMIFDRMWDFAQIMPESSENTVQGMFMRSATRIERLSPKSCCETTALYLFMSRSFVHEAKFDDKTRFPHHGSGLKSSEIGGRCLLSLRTLFLPFTGGYRAHLALLDLELNTQSRYARALGKQGDRRYRSRLQKSPGLDPLFSVMRTQGSKGYECIYNEAKSAIRSWLDDRRLWVTTRTSFDFVTTSIYRPLLATVGTTPMTPTEMEDLLRVYRITFCYWDDIELIEDPFERLKQTLLLLHINQRFRGLALAQRALWQKIRLEWPLEATTFYRNQYQRDISEVDAEPNTGISVCLDTENLGHGRISTKKQAGWGTFFEEAMDEIVSLDLKICTGQGSVVLADAINNIPAPQLRRLTLNLDEAITDNAGIHRLCNKIAPKLEEVHIHAALPYDFTSFQALHTMDIRLGHHNIKALFPMLSGLPNLESVALVGMEKWMGQALPASPALPVLLEACHSLSITHFYASVVNHILSGLILPQLCELVVKEGIFFTDNEIDTSLPAVLPLISHPAVPRDWLHVGLHPDRMVLRMQGWLYETYWGQATLRDPRRLIYWIKRSITALNETVILDPGKLLIETSVLNRNADKANLIFLTRPNQHILLNHAFKCWPSVRELYVLGQATAVVQALYNPQDIPLPDLESITFVQLAGATTKTSCDEKFIKMVGQLKKVTFRNIQTSGTQLTMATTEF